MNFRVFLWGVVAVTTALFLLFAYQLKQPKNEFVHSAMIGKPMPEFALKPAVPALPGLASADLTDGKPRLVNVFGSWCIPCRAEAPYLEQLHQNGADIVGIAIRDKTEDLTAFLAQYGNPFSRIGADDISAVQLELGSSGVPETFVIDGKGIIRYQHIGDIREEHVAVLLRELEKAGS